MPQPFAIASQPLAKADKAKRLAFGFAYVHKIGDEQQVVDHSGDCVTVLDEEAFEDAVYLYNRTSRASNEMHLTKEAGDTLVESFFITKEKLIAIGVPEDALGTVKFGWWQGHYVPDDEVWAEVESGKYAMFSIEGDGDRIPTEST